jgi:hypothetical protein
MAFTGMLPYLQMLCDWHADAGDVPMLIIDAHVENVTMTSSK